MSSGRGRGRGETDYPMSAEPNVGLHPRTLKS